jgi:hypothetical protein
MENILQNLLGGGQRQQYQDFVQRYEQGHPSEGYSDQEIMERYQAVAPQIPNDVYQSSAEQAFARLTPQERAEFAQFLQQRAQQQHIALPMMDANRGGQVPQDPGMLAQMAAQLNQRQPGMLGQLLGGNAPGNQDAGAGGQLGSLLSNPVAKAALAGIAAMAVKNLMDRRAA